MTTNFKDLCKEVVFNTVFSTYAKDLKRFLYFRFNDMASAEDVLQETFIKLWTNCKDVVYEKVKSYLYTLANNAFLDIKKHEKTVLKHQQNYINYNKSEDPEFLLIEEEYLIKVENTINNLPEKEKTVYKLSRFEDKKYIEIADELNISIKTVEKRMHNALIYIKKHLGKRI